MVKENPWHTHQPTKEMQHFLLHLNCSAFFQILCANVVLKKTFFCDDFVQNYLDVAQQRFKELTIQRNQHHNEIRRLSQNYTNLTSQTIQQNEDTLL